MVYRLVQVVAAVLCWSGASLASFGDLPDDEEQSREEPTSEIAESAGSDESDPADDWERSTGGVFFNPVGLFLGFVNAEIVGAVGDHAAFTVGAAHMVREGVEGAVGNIGFQLYPVGVFRGVYVAPSAGIVKVSDATALVSGALVGYHWDWRPVSMRIGFGALHVSGDVGGEKFSGTQPYADVSLGFTWRSD